MIHQISPAADDVADEEWDSKLADLQRKANKHAKADTRGLESPFVLLGDEDALRRELGEERWDGVYKTAMER